MSTKDETVRRFVNAENFKKLIVCVTKPKYIYHKIISICTRCPNFSEQGPTFINGTPCTFLFFNIYFNKLRPVCLTRNIYESKINGEV